VNSLTAHCFVPAPDQHSHLFMCVCGLSWGAAIHHRGHQHRRRLEAHTGPTPEPMGVGLTPRPY
jgi:hypothetical protein